jgi:hypothetical protein
VLGTGRKQGTKPGMEQIERTMQKTTKKKSTTKKAILRFLGGLNAVSKALARPSPRGERETSETAS